MGREGRWLCCRSRDGTGDVDAAIIQGTRGDPATAQSGGDREKPEEAFSDFSHIVNCTGCVTKCLNDLAPANDQDAIFQAC